MSTTTIQHLASTVLRPGGPDAVILLGAGASIKSGIPLSGQLVEQAARWAFCRDNGRHHNDPTVVRSDWLPWLHNHSWYEINQSGADNYSAVIQHLLQPQEDRKTFFLRVIKPGVPASTGYARLVELMADEIIRTVLTTNFDAVLPDFCSGRTRPHHVEVIKTPADYTKFSTYPSNPQFLYLHGSVEHYTDQNLLKEVQRLEPDLVSQLVPLLRDHPLVVIGYRGAEPSIMRHLLIEQAGLAKHFRHGIFWCALNKDLEHGLHPLVTELADSIGGNLQLVPIAGFDEVFEDLWQAYETSPVQSLAIAHSINQFVTDSIPADMRPTEGATLEELDWHSIQTRIPEYCRRMELSVPTPIDRTWLTEKLCELDLAVKQDGLWAVTKAGYLLFGKEPHRRIPSAKTEIHYGHETEVVEGNLWKQLDAIMEELEDINQPFRLKGPVSDDVFPYSPLALKEVIVNALVHRSYEATFPVEIRIERTHISVMNSGGLVEDVFKIVGLPLQERIERGARGIKGYRNPVIADLFYGAGAMDKAGSGLADVQVWVRENEGRVIFGPTANNESFQVTLHRRLEQVDEVTKTAAPTTLTARYISNLLEITELPKVIWRGHTEARKAKDVWDATGANSLPPFITAKGQLLSFSNLLDPSNLLSTQVAQNTVQQVTLTDLCENEQDERLLVYLLNQSLFKHLESRGLIIDKKRKRAYFPRTKQGSRELTYQARLRKATRTVTKPFVSRITQQVRYWEHKALKFQFERFGNTWTLQILPGYVFTIDGYRSLLEGERVAVLATRRASHDYNMQVHNDLFFWTWVLSDGKEDFELEAGGSHISLRGRVAEHEVRDVLPSPDGEEDFDPQTEDELSEIEEQLAIIAEFSRDSIMTERHAKRFKPKRAGRVVTKSTKDQK